MASSVPAAVENWPQRCSGVPGAGSTRLGSCPALRYVRPPEMSCRFAIFDVDDVIVDTDRAGALAERAVVEPLRKRIGDGAAARVREAFSNGYDILRTQLRRPAGEEGEEFAQHHARIRGWQESILAAGFELKLWSRDSLLAIALEDAGVPVTGDLVTAAADEYWRVIAEKTRIHDDAALIVPRLRARGIAVHLATNSDGFLRFDPRVHAFTYDPAYAATRKLARLACIEQIGLSGQDVSVGDPIGKPKRAFYERVLEDFSAKIGDRIDPAQTIAVGDSLTNDVLPFLALGVKRGAWLVRAREGRPHEPLEGHPGVDVIGRLTDLEQLG